MDQVNQPILLFMLHYRRVSRRKTLHYLFTSACGKRLPRSVGRTSPDGSSRPVQGLLEPWFFVRAAHPHSEPDLRLFAAFRIPAAFQIATRCGGPSPRARHRRWRPGANSFSTKSRVDDEATVKIVRESACAAALANSFATAIAVDKCQGFLQT